jgi:hypothetical protein
MLAVMRWLWVAVMIVGCSGETDRAADCEMLDPEACDVGGCQLFMGWDVTRTDAAGERCFDPTASGGEQTVLGCFPRPRGGDLAIYHAYDSSTDRCFAVGSNAFVPPGWPLCSAALDECP